MGFFIALACYQYHMRYYSRIDALSSFFLCLRFPLKRGLLKLQVHQLPIYTIDRHISFEIVTKSPQTFIRKLGKINV